MNDEAARARRLAPRFAIQVGSICKREREVGRIHCSYNMQAAETFSFLDCLP